MPSSYEIAIDDLPLLAHLFENLIDLALLEHESFTGVLGPSDAGNGGQPILLFLASDNVVLEHRLVLRQRMRVVLMLWAWHQVVLADVDVPKKTPSL
jgi:hypothetical protein